MANVSHVCTVQGGGFAPGLSTVRYRLAPAGTSPTTLPWTQVGVYATGAGYAVVLPVDDATSYVLEWGNGQTPEKVTQVSINPGTPGPQGVPGTVTVLDSGSLATVYCTDEDLAVRAASDYLALTPMSWEVCKGSDGVFDAGDLWTLTSAGVDFEAQGLRPAHVMRLSKPLNLYSASGRLYAVSSVSGHSVTLRPIGRAAGAGSPPSPAGGITSVEFNSRSMAAQIEDATYEINQLEGVDPNVPGKGPSDLYDPRTLRQFCVLTVLRRQYVDAVRSNSGDFALKVKLLGEELDRVRSRLVLRWGQKGDSAPPTTFPGMCRITR